MGRGAGAGRRAMAEMSVDQCAPLTAARASRRSNARAPNGRRGDELSRGARAPDRREAAEVAGGTDAVDESSVCSVLSVRC